MKSISRHLVPRGAFLSRLVIIASAIIFATSYPQYLLADDSVILTVSGNSQKTSRGSLDLSLSEFEAIGMAEVVTSTPWHKEKTRFRGVSGAAFRDFFQISGSEIRATALNDYSVTLPVSDLDIEGLIFATRVEATPLSVRDKGPIFIVYPFDLKPELKSEVNYGRSIWQLRSIEFK